MTDLGKIPGKKGPSPSEEAKRKKGPDSEAFREMMKVGKVRETDPDEKKKRKGQAEAEEEQAAQQAAQAGPPIHQGLGSEAAPPPFLPENEPRIAETAPSLPTSTAPAHKKKRKEAEEATKKEAITAPTKKHPIEKGQGKKPPRALDHPPLPPSPKARETPQQQHAAQVQPHKVAQESKGPTEPKKKEEPASIGTAGIVEKPLPPGGWEATKKEDKKEKPTIPSMEVQAAPPSPQTGVQPAQPEVELAPLSAAFARLPPQIVQIFERMVGVMTVMNETGIKETTITLNNPQYAKSVFYGAQIVISEFATAPKVLNIELKGSQQALNLMGANSEELVAAFQAGKYNFKVNRIDLSQQSSGAEIKKKQAQRVKRKKTGGG